MPATATDAIVSVPPPSTLTGVARVLVHSGRLTARKAEELTKGARDRKQSFIASALEAKALTSISAKPALTNSTPRLQRKIVTTRWTTWSRATTWGRSCLKVRLRFLEAVDVEPRLTVITRRQGLGLLLGTGASTVGLNSRAKPSTVCRPLTPETRSNHQALVLDPGRYCVAVDFMQKSESDAGHSWPPYDHALIRIYGSDIEIDLAGKTLHTESVSSGVLAYTQGNVGHARSERRSFGLETRRITIKNGTIDLRGRGTGVRLIDRWFLANADENVPPETATGYLPSAFVLEDLTIKTDHNAIELEGEGNIVRRCRIESSGNVAVALAGPNGLVTDNQIIFKEPTIPTDLASICRADISLLWQAREARRLTRAVILLRQASGTTISNNRITLEGESSTRHSVYVRDGSRNVEVRNNTFTGITKPVTLLEGSSAEVADNVFVK